MLHFLFAGVFTATIDPHEQKVTVTGSVGVETLLRKLVRAGKHAEVWPEENLDGNGKSSGKAKKKNKNEQKETQGLQNKGIITESAAKCESKSKSSSSSNSKTGGGESPEKSPAAGSHVPPEGGGGGSGKKKKKKDQGSGGNGNGNGSNVGLSPASKGAPAHTGFQFQNPTWQAVGQQQVNLNPTRQQSFFSYYPEIGYPPMFYVAAYNNNNRLYNYPMGGRVGPSYYVPPSPYMCAGLDQDGSSSYQFQSAPLVSSFEIFSDENANGCSIM